MISSLLIRGMIAGVVAGLLAFGFARTFGEPSVTWAIALEDSGGAMLHDDGQHPSVQSHAHEDGDELVSRSTQAGLGLFTATVVYGAAFGGIFALVFAFAWGRVGAVSPRTLAALLALVGFVVLIVVPEIKYPANPPAVGQGETIGFRTATFLMMLVMSVAAAAVAAVIRARLVSALGAWNATLVAGAAFVIVVAATMLALPAINEVPDGFPAALLWQFRLAALGTQAVLWGALGIAFGFAAERRLARTV